MITNTIILDQIIEANRLGELTEDLLTSLKAIAKHCCKRYVSTWPNYPYIDELENEVLLRLCTSWNKFEVTKSQKPYTFLITSAECAITGAIARERRELQIKRDLEEYLSTGVTNDLPNM